MNGHERNAGTIGHEHTNQVNGAYGNTQRVNLIALRETIPLPSKTIDTKSILTSWNSCVKSDGFKRILQEIKVSRPEESPQTIAVDTVGQFANSFIKNTLVSLANFPENFRPITFAIGWDYLAGIHTVMEQFMPVLEDKDKHLTPEDIAESFKNNVSGALPNYPTIDQEIEKAVKLNALIQKDPSGFLLMDYLVNAVKQEFEKPQYQRYGFLPIANPDFAILGAEIAGIIYKASYSALTTQI